jgi:sugar (pentulose or hexulose) kinase
VTEGVLVGVDFGTSACKAGVVSVDGRELAHARVATPWRRVPTGAELDPQAFVDVTLEAVDEALDRAGGGNILALGVTSMAETGVLLDDDGAPVAPAIAWHDSRGEAEARRLADDLGEGRFTTHTGLPPRPLCSASKYLWLRGHEAAAATGRRWLNVSEWIVHCLGGRQAGELSLASRTGWLELGARAWWDEALALCDAPDDFLPEPVQAGTPLGEVAEGPARLRGAVLTVAGHDHPCGAVGAGAVGADTVYDSCGTAEAFVAQMEPPASDETVRRLVEYGITVGWHVVPGRHSLLGAQRTGLGLQRFLDLLGVDRDGLPALDDAAIAAPADADGLTVVDVEGDSATVTGIGPSPSPALLWRAALDAAAERAAAILRTMEAERGAAREVVVAGGWAHSRGFRAAKQSHQGAFRHVGGVVEAGVRGAALLSGVAAGLFDGLADLPPPPQSHGRDRRERTA